MHCKLTKLTIVSTVFVLCLVFIPVSFVSAACEGLINPDGGYDQAYIDCLLRENTRSIDEQNRAYQAGGERARADYQRQISTQGIPAFLDRVAEVLNNLAPFIIGLAILVILWGIFRYISKAGEEEKRAEGRMFIIYGIIGLFIMISIWGLVNILDKTFLLSKDAPSAYPHLPDVPLR